ILDRLNSTVSMNITQCIAECGSECKQYMVRLLTYLPGIPLAKIPLDQQNLYKVGRIVAQMDKVLQEEFQHVTLKSLHREDFIWNLSNTHHLENYLAALGGSRSCLTIEQVIQQFKAQIFPNLSKFRKSKFNI
uniref:Hydroxylysine kinase-like n=2 Tax=Callorhinchus milii TaxID=7868 RepID=A0A4W3GDP7_CALMI